MESRKSHNTKWYKLDNSAIVYTSTETKSYANVFRLAVIMNDIVDPVRLQKAFETTLPRFPYFAVRIRRGAFWCYMEPNNKPVPTVVYDQYAPCLPIHYKENNGYPIRVLYYHKRISVEIFHALTDGYGGLVFLRTLIAAYVKTQGIPIPCTHGVLNVNDAILEGEDEDAYFKYGTAGNTMKINDKKAYQVKGTPISAEYHTYVISGIVPVKELLATAKKYGVTITEYLTALLLSILYDKQMKENKFGKPKPLRIGVPVNCRQFFPTNSLRNFILLLSPFIDPAIDAYTFEEILYDVKSYLKYNLNPKFLKAMMTGNIKTETNLFIRPVPLFIKRMVVAAFYKRLGDQQNSGVFTNLGVFQIPEELKPFINRVEVLMGRPYSHSLNCGIISYQDQATISFTSMIEETDIEREFFRKLIQAGIHVKIETNR